MTGQVHRRPAGTDNPKIVTGEIEVVAQRLDLLNQAEVLPFPVDDPEVAGKVNEELRLQYRYLDLRRPEIIRNLRLRSRIASARTTCAAGPWGDAADGTPRSVHACP